MAATQPETQLDLRFFRLTGVALVVATSVAGAVTLSLTIGESRALYLAQHEQIKLAPELASATLDVTLP